MLFREAANLICWSRIGISVILMFIVEARLGWAVLYSVAFISDVWDGWCFRRVPEGERPNHWFNRLPISMDPLADFILVGGGLIHVAESKQADVNTFVAMAIILIVWQVIAQNASDRVFSIMMTVLTYFWFGMMVLTVGLVWHVSLAMPGWLIGFAVTLVAFYACYFRLKPEESRAIRKRGMI